MAVLYNSTIHGLRFALHMKRFQGKAVSRLLMGVTSHLMVGFQAGIDIVLCTILLFFLCAPASENQRILIWQKGGCIFIDSLFEGVVILWMGDLRFDFPQRYPNTCDYLLRRIEGRKGGEGHVLFGSSKGGISHFGR